MNKDIKYMTLALKEAKKAYQKDEVPVGCVIVYQDQVLAKAYNQRKKTNSIFGHAEILAMKKASKKMNSWILEGCTMYVTLEPCLMCTGAIFQSRINRVVFATEEPKFGVLGSVMDISECKGFNHQIVITKGVLKEESSQLLKSFFQELRKKR